MSDGGHINDAQEAPPTLSNKLWSIEFIKDNKKEFIEDKETTILKIAKNLQDEGYVMGRGDGKTFMIKVIL